MTAINVFDRPVLFARRQRATSDITKADFLHKAVFEDMLERLDDIKRGFEVALDLHTRPEDLSATLAAHPKIHTLRKARFYQTGEEDVTLLEGETLRADEASLDLIFSHLHMHTINDLPGVLAQCRRALKPDGLLLASLFGGTTLSELRQALLQAELDVTGGASPRVAPFTSVQDIGMLLQRAGFALPLVDAHTYTALYPDIFHLMADLRQMGETNAITERLKRPTRREVFLRAGQYYAEKYAHDDGQIPASFEVITLTAWAPALSQPKPLAPGSAKARLAEALDVDEVKLKR